MNNDVITFAVKDTNGCYYTGYCPICGKEIDWKALKGGEQ